MVSNSQGNHWNKWFFKSPAQVIFVWEAVRNKICLPWFPGLITLISDYSNHCKQLFWFSVSFSSSFNSLNFRKWFSNTHAIIKIHNIPVLNKIGLCKCWFNFNHCLQWFFMFLRKKSPKQVIFPVDPRWLRAPRVVVFCPRVVLF